MREKYIKLLLERCVKVNKSKVLFINYDVINQDFVDDIVKYAKSIGVEVYLDKEDLKQEHDILKNIELDKIDTHPYFDKSIWDKYANNNASFLIFRSPQPGIMDDISSEKISRAEYIKRVTKSIYKERQLNNDIYWCIAALPNIIWANSMFKDNNSSYKLLEDAIYKACMVDKNDPIEEWDSHLNKNKKQIKKLNDLKIKLLHYKNSLGTDLTIELLEDGFWRDASSEGIVNMPTYEIYTSPDYRKTNGIVYSSKPLNYGGGIIEEFWIKFKDGKAIDCGARKGEDILREIIDSDSNACYLGECALVENNSPISNTNLVFGTTLIDENASCHLALGSGFKKCMNSSKDLSVEELLQKGLNISNIHVDFMIGTSDLEITATTYDNQKIKIFENGNFKK